MRDNWEMYKRRRYLGYDRPKQGNPKKMKTLWIVAGVLIFLLFLALCSGGGCGGGSCGVPAGHVPM